MSEKFSFKAAEELISILNNASSSLENQNESLFVLYKQLRVNFNDTKYDEYYLTITRTYDECIEIIRCINEIIVRIEDYKSTLYRYYIEDIIGKIVVPIITIGLLKNRKKHNENYINDFNKSIKEILTSEDVPYSAKLVYMRIGSRCNVISAEHSGTAFYDPIKNGIAFNLGEDLYNECGKLSTYFHEIGHMIDYNAKPGTNLSDDEIYINALRNDCNEYVSNIMKNNDCSQDKAYLIIKSELMKDNNLYADVSDIMGALTDCRCQNLWGHSKSYWDFDKRRMQREAFANMYSSSMQGEKKINIMKEYFPSAYHRFEEILEEVK